MVVTLLSTKAKTMQPEVIIQIKTFAITGFSFQNVGDVVTQCVVNYKTLDVSGNLLENLSKSITGSELTGVMHTVVTGGVTREAEIRNALYAYMVAQGIFAA